MKKTLKFDYIPVMRPVMREDLTMIPLAASGELKDRFNIYWNSNCVFKDIDPVTETFEKGLVKRETTVELKENNTILLDNVQTFKDESLNLNATINLKQLKPDTWNLELLYDLSPCQNNEYETFSQRFLVHNESTHFKLNGKALIVNTPIKSGKTLQCKKDFYWRGVTPICFELEEYGHSMEMDQRFIQVVRFTLL